MTRGVVKIWSMALGLALLLEGMMPFLFPRLWKQAVDRIARMGDGQVRFIGLLAVLGGAAVLALATIF